MELAPDEPSSQFRGGVAEACVVIRDKRKSDTIGGWRLSEPEAVSLARNVLAEQFNPVRGIILVRPGEEAVMYRYGSVISE